MFGLEAVGAVRESKLLPQPVFGDGGAGFQRLVIVSGVAPAAEQRRGRAAEIVAEARFGLVVKKMSGYAIGAELACGEAAPGPAGPAARPLHRGHEPTAPGLQPRRVACPVARPAPAAINARIDHHRLLIR